ncbi:unnamed protein product [Symbiodinium sp. CCMP2592]|nr:unnamed protein product [Symbiodinium sp. CCMP2592]
MFGMALAENKSPLQADDECHAEVCALHALQKRGVVLEHRMSPPGTLPADKAPDVRDLNGNENLMPQAFVAAVARDCVHEAPEIFARQRDFYEIMESPQGYAQRELQADRIRRKCRQPQPPHLQIVGQPGGPHRVNMSAGYVHAPPIHSAPNRTALFKTCFLVIFRAKIQPAPKGMLFVHEGGREAGIAMGESTLLHVESCYQDYLNELRDVDLVFVDQRGMGLSLAGLLSVLLPRRLSSNYFR